MLQAAFHQDAQTACSKAHGPILARMKSRTRTPLCRRPSRQAVQRRPRSGLRREEAVVDSTNVPSGSEIDKGNGRRLKEFLCTTLNNKTRPSIVTALPLSRVSPGPLHAASLD